MKTVFYNAEVYTGEAEPKQAFIVEDGVFAAAGTNEEIFTLAEGAEKVDLGGRFVCPGFNDSHMHVLSYGVALNAARLDEHTDSLEGMLEYFRTF
ncbi:MAG: amidohydrolase family protein, partial [Clostridia bacterium]|nr:amidohydrolase family protein [Clostridia bacterium]